MELTDLVAQLGGVCSWSDLRACASARRVRKATAQGLLVRVSRGRYTLPGLDAARALATRAGATASHTTAALHWGWGVKWAPAEPHVTLPRGRKLRAHARSGVVRHWRTLAQGDVVDGWVTSKVRTVVDCCLDLPFDEALAVADSALRSGVQLADVVPAAAALPPRQRRRVGRVLLHADHRAANPFESVLRAICLSVKGLTVVPQHVVKARGFYARVDLADADLMIVIEAESLEFHADAAALQHDCRRYTGLGARGWVVLRFTWSEVMTQPHYVREALTMTAAVRRTATKGQARTGSAETGAVVAVRRSV
ncbi:MAG: type IV toxin-antitoxin system AbiEi family antitoxin domain-containing protein [Terrabacter sp.]|nr:type IV toxin-antitoxin system AbiEi family antitoxin domain-containing protein [Terrabacter sp.]